MKIVSHTPGVFQMPPFSVATAAIKFLSMYSVSMAATGPVISSSNITPGKSAVASRFCLYQAIQSIFSIPLKFLLGAVPEIQISSVFCHLGVFHQLLNLFFTHCGIWLLVHLQCFIIHPVFKQQQNLVLNYFSCWSHINGIIFEE